ncbi:MAG: hypothetical protein QY314_03065 [Candidatus Dojkabacteria bacterium]|nr:MAG: hypothetical protein QY314_03065 [Candidatus Dojkabacteria bacterium]
MLKIQVGKNTPSFARTVVVKATSAGKLVILADEEEVSISDASSNIETVITGTNPTGVLVNGVKYDSVIVVTNTGMTEFSWSVNFGQRYYNEKLPITITPMAMSND